MAESAPAVHPAVKTPDPAIGRRRRRQVTLMAGVASIGCLALAAVGISRPFDVLLIRRLDIVSLLGVVGVILLVVAAFASPAPRFLRTVAVFMVGPGILLALGLLVALAFDVGGGYQEVDSVGVPDTSVRVASIERSGSLGGSEVVLQGRLGPFLRERSLMNTSDCVVSLEASGPRQVVLLVEPQSGCAVALRPSNRYQVTVLEDGWSTDVRQVES